MSDPVLEGGCLCGAVRYKVRFNTPYIDYCHCVMCRKSTGGLAPAWIQVEPADFTLTRGTLGVFVSSPKASRHFCTRCGSQIAMTDPAGRSTGITVATLDDPEAVRPTVHGWDSARPSWLCIADDLPRHPEDVPYDI